MGLRLILILAACSLTLTAQKISSGYVEDFPIGDLKTFAFMAQDRQQPDALADDAESAEFIKNQLIQAMTAAGFTLTVENPDFVIAYYAKTYLRSTYRFVGYKTLDSEIAMSQDNYDTGVLIVDFVSLERNQSVWRGRADKTINQKNAPKVIEKACQKLIRQFEKDSKTQAKRRKR